MTKPDHRSGTTPRRTNEAYEGAKVKELAYFDAKFHMATSRNAAPTLTTKWFDERIDQLDHDHQMEKLGRRK